MKKPDRWMYPAYIVQTGIIFNIVFALTHGEFSAAGVGVFAFILGMIPYYFSRKTKIVFPWFVYFLISLALLIHISGYIHARYITIPNWDTIAHTVSGSMVALLGFIGIMFLDKIKRYHLDPPFIAFFIVLFALAMEYLWEIYEFLVDTFFGGSLAGKMQPDNTDTMMDMIFVFIPAVIIAVCSWYYLRKKGKENVMNEMIQESPYFAE
ncbi:MAG: hypothetical protein JXA44_07355 [Methanospirillaceae archaeon]|nr:hypothetical protein [Methanospirillaceae archaeon]